MEEKQILAQFRALGEPNRLAILRLLSKGPLPGVEILLRSGVSQPNLSRHMRTLREAGLVEEERRGRNLLYALAPGPLVKAALQALGEPIGREAARFEAEGRARTASEAPGRSEAEDPARDDFQDWLL